MADVDDGQDYQALSAALLSSPKLQQLDISGWVGMPGITWQNIFKPAQQLSQLSSLILPGSWQYWVRMAAADVQAMVQCCPALRTLHGGAVLSVQHLLGGLQQLTCLHAMQAFLPADTGALAESTGLRELQLYLTKGAGGITAGDVVPLLALTHVTCLSFPVARDVTGKPMAGPQLVSNTAAEVLQQLISLRHLNLEGISLSVRQLQGLTTLTQLTYLNFCLKSAEDEPSMPAQFTNKVCMQHLQIIYSVAMNFPPVHICL